MTKKRYSVRYEKDAQKALKKMDKHQARLLLSWISKHLNGTAFPRQFGRALTGNKNEQWRYRVGNYRIIAHIDDETITILVLEIGHRREIYKK